VSQSKSLDASREHVLLRTVMLELVIALSMVSLFSAWFASFFDRRVRLRFVPRWRHGRCRRVTLVNGVLNHSFLLLRTYGPGRTRLYRYCFARGMRFGVRGGCIPNFSFGSRKTVACLLSAIAFVAGSWYLMLSRVV
jgi:hypothetical protein